MKILSPSSRLAQFGVVIVATGFAFFIVGVFPDLIRLDRTPGVGIVQIGVFLFGLTLMTLGSYTYLYATRHRAQPSRLREDIGARLMATGLVISYAAGLADVLGFGSHYGVERPLFGWFQAVGVALGVMVVIVGIFMYSVK